MASTACRRCFDASISFVAREARHAGHKRMEAFAICTELLPRVRVNRYSTGRCFGWFA